MKAYGLIVILLLATTVLAQTDVVTPLVDSITPTAVSQGSGIDVTVEGSGLADTRTVSITPADGFTITRLDVSDSEITFRINMTCDAEAGKRKLTIGDLTQDANGVPFYFWGEERDCDAIAADEQAKLDALKPSIGALFPRMVEAGKTENGYFTGSNLETTTKITIVGTGLTARLLPGATAERLPVEFTADPKASLGGRGIIITFKDGTELRKFRNTDDTLRIDVIEAKPVKPEETAPLRKPVVTATDEQSDDSDTTDETPMLIAAPQEPVACADIDILVNDKPVGEVITLEGDVPFTIKMADGVFIQRVWVETEKPVVKRVLNKFLAEFAGESADSCQKKTKTITLSENAPKGTYPVTLHIKYLDANLERKTYEKQLTLDVPKGSTMANWLNKEAQAILAARYAGPLARLNRDIGFDDLSIEDYEQLGITPQDIAKAMRLWRNGDKEGAMKILGDLKKTGESTRVAKVADVEKLGETFKGIIIKQREGDIDIDTQVDVRTFEVEHNGKKIVKSRVTIEIPSSQRLLGNGNIIVYIPKSVAESAAELEFSEDVEVIEEDPVVKWAFDNVPENQHKEVGITVSGAANAEDIVVQTTARNPGALARLFLWLAGLFGV